MLINSSIHLFFNLLYLVHDFVHVDAVAVRQLLKIAISALKQKQYFALQFNYRVIETISSFSFFLYNSEICILTAYMSTLFSLSSFGYNILLHSWQNLMPTNPGPSSCVSYPVIFDIIARQIDLPQSEYPQKIRRNRR